MATMVSTTAPADRPIEVRGATVLPAENWPTAMATVAPRNNTNAAAYRRREVRRNRRRAL